MLLKLFTIMFSLFCVRNIKKFRNQIVNYDNLIKTSHPIESTPYFKSVISYISGNCEFNSKISKGEIINQIEEKIIKDLDHAQSIVKPINQDIILLHGFENLTDYKDDIWNIGDIIEFKGALSKTTSYKVAELFAKTYESPYLRKFMLVNYSKNSRHIIPDIKIKSLNYELENDSEYEFLRINDKLKLSCVEYELGMFYINKYYVFEDVSE